MSHYEDVYTLAVLVFRYHRLHFSATPLLVPTFFLSILILGLYQYWPGSWDSPCTATKYFVVAWFSLWMQWFKFYFNLFSLLCILSASPVNETVNFSELQAWIETCRKVNIILTLSYLRCKKERTHFLTLSTFSAFYKVSCQVIW